MNTRKMGPQSGKLVPCLASKWHGHHPSEEPCPECDPDSVKQVAGTEEPSQPDEYTYFGQGWMWP